MPSRVLNVVGSLLLLFALAGSALGQGTGRVFPDPISFDEMNSLLEPLGLSEAQLQVAAAAHEVYLTRSLELRHGAIDTWLSQNGGGAPMGYGSDREALEKALRSRRSIRRQMRDLDEVLFSSLHDGLSDAQKPILPRIAARRTRDRQEADSTFSGMGRPSLPALDLYDGIARANLSDDVVEKIDPLLAAYEAQINPMWTVIADERDKLPLQTFDRQSSRRIAMEDAEAQLAEAREKQDGVDPEDRRAFEELIRDVAAAALVEMQGGGDDQQGPGRLGRTYGRVSSLNRRLLDDLRQHLETEVSDRLERRYVAAAYPMLGMPRDPVTSRSRRWLKKNEESELAAAVRDFVQENSQGRRALLWRYLAAAETAGFPVNTNGFAFYGSGMGSNTDAPSEEDAIDRTRKSLASHDENALDRYLALVGEPREDSSGARTISLGDGTSITVSAGDDDEGEPMEFTGAMVIMATDVTGDLAGGAGGVFVTTLSAPITVMGDVDTDSSLEVVEFSMFGNGDWLPGALPKDDIDDLLDDLQVDDATRGLVETMHGDYHTAYDELDSETLRPAEAAVAAAGRMSNAGDVNVAGAFSDVRRGMEAVQVSDNALFEDLGLVLPETHEAILDRYRRMRQLAWFDQRSSGGMSFGMGSDARESEVNLWAAANDAGVPASGAAADLLDEWLVNAIATRQSSWTSALATSEKQIADSVERRKSSEGGMMMFSVPSAGENDDNKHEQALAARDLVRTVMGIVDATTGFALEDAFLRAAYPAIYTNDGGLNAQFTQAAGAELSSDRRFELTELRTNWNLGRAAIQLRMVERTRVFDAEQAEAAEGEFNPSRFKAYQRYQQDLEALRFELKNLKEQTGQALEGFGG